MLVRTGTVEDKERLYELDKLYFSEEYQVPSDFVDKVIDINPSVYRVVESDGTIQGFYSLFPLPLKEFEQVLHGEISELDLPRYLVSYDDEPKDFCLYVAGFIVDQKNPSSHHYTSALLRDLLLMVGDLQRQGFHIAYLGVIAVTLDGIKFCSRLGMKEVGTIHHQDIVFKMPVSPTWSLKETLTF